MAAHRLVAWSLVSARLAADGRRQRRRDAVSAPADRRAAAAAAAAAARRQVALMELLGADVQTISQLAYRRLFLRYITTYT